MNDIKFRNLDNWKEDKSELIGYYAKSELDEKFFHDYYICDEIDEYCLKIVDAEDEFATKISLNNLVKQICPLENENKELKAKVAALESNYYTKSECDNKYAVKPHNALVLENRYYTKDSNGSYMFEGYHGEHFIIHVMFPDGSSININQIISCKYESFKANA